MEASMKKILFTVGMMNIGGVEKSLISLLSAIPKGKYDITILMLEKTGELLKEIPDWIKVEEATWFSKIKPIILQPPQQTIRDFYKSKKYFKILFFIYSYLLSKKYDNRHMYYKHVFQDVPHNSTNYDIAISYQGPNDIMDFYIANKVTASQKISWVHFDVSMFKMNINLYHKLYRKFNKVFVVSKIAKERLIERIPTVENKTEVFNNIISDKLINEMAKRDIELDEDYKGLKIVTVARLSKEKGHDIAIKVLSRLRKKGYEIRWYCIGEGNERKEYEQLIEEYDLKEDFILIGSNPNPFPFIAKSDIYVQTSRHEGYCLTLAEAKCLKKPIVTTNFIGAYEQIINGFNGWIVSPKENELYEKIKFLIDYPLEREKLSLNLSKIEINTTGEINKFISYIN
jgi:glycosyltransferase involved in cell wall biosynthesis